MRWSSRVNVIVLVVSLLVLCSGSIDDRRLVASDFFNRAIEQIARHRRIFLDGFANGTWMLDKQDEHSHATGQEDEEEEGRGRRKRLRQMNRTLMAIVMAFSLKFMLLIPTFIGTLILLKFTTGLAGFFYALFAAVLGLDHQHEGRLF